ncbi:MAG: homoserine dehydrogenase [Rhodoferax sp.]
MYQDHQGNFACGPFHVAAPLALPPLRVGLLGLGTVGGGTYRVLKRNGNVIAARTGRGIAITMVAVRNLARAASVVGDDVALVDDPFQVVDNPDIDVVVEVMGGTTLARDLVLRAIANGKHVVTANKALLAEHGAEIFAAAHVQGVVVAYEGAVAVSIPIIKALREGLTANRIEWVAGIINGTTNFILTQMRSHGLGFGDALEEAQRLGYAEADPTFDVEGVDAAHKLTLLASNAFGVPVQFDKVYTEGITALQLDDMGLAERLGYRVKLLGIAKRTDHGIELRVHPTLIPHDHLLAQVHGSMNAVLVKSDAAGVTMYYGAGAGSEQTASAVIADLVDVARVAGTRHGDRVPYLAFQPHAVQALPVAAMTDVMTAYYLRVDVCDHEQAAPQLRNCLAQAGVHVERLEVFATSDGCGASSIVVLTHPARDSEVRRVMAELAHLPTQIGGVHAIRVESLG